MTILTRSVASNIATANNSNNVNVQLQMTDRSRRYNARCNRRDDSQMSENAGGQQPVTVTVSAANTTAIRSRIVLWPFNIRLF